MNFDRLREFTRKEHSRLLELYGLKERSHLKHLICLKIGEEFGELMEEVLSLEKIQRKEKLDGWKDKTGDEIADTILTILLLAENLGIDFEEELEKGIKKREERKY